MSGIPQLETERLILRAPQIEDLDAMAQFFASPRSHSVGGPLDRGQVWRAGESFDQQSVLPRRVRSVE